MEYDFLQSLQIVALEAVLRPDWEATYRYISRWYSTTFHTPLHLVDDLPIAEVLQHYFEAAYERMDEAKLRDVAIEISESPEEKRLRESGEEKILAAEAEAVARTVARMKKVMERTNLAADSLGKMRLRPTAKTVAELKAIEHGADGLSSPVDLSQLLSGVPPAPKPRSPAEMMGDVPSPTILRGDEIPDDFDALGGNLPSKPKHKP